MRRTIFDHTPDGLRQRLADMERQVADLQRVREAPPQYVEPEFANVNVRNAAQLLCMSASADSIASGGDYVTFGSILAQHGFPDVVAAGQSWTHPTGGVYHLDYEHAWASYTGGGAIELEIDGVVSAAGTIASGTSGQEGRGSIPYIATEGSVGKIKVTQSSGSAQTCDAVVRLSITDPSPTTTVSNTYEVTPAVSSRAASPMGETFIDNNFSFVWDGTGTLVLAATAAGTGAITVDERLILDVVHADASTGTMTHDFATSGSSGLTPAGPIDVTAHFEAGTNSVRVRLQDIYGGQVSSTAVWLVQV